MRKRLLNLLLLHPKRQAPQRLSDSAKKLPQRPKNSTPPTDFAVTKGI